ncbi:hypothetical protein AVT69_gp136 [Pseudomonas phage PhiPA3]|uniref:Uncharacterized protein 138 n=1 Tax=Pseudomonas phage PhiPA3 TaxID=998086 RepID=F8SK11_BPPA3|nr:hypothetical protein AVT69_gp136 [Pseudomonas phage PhiPA3]AEH03561.1 hypothetical protein [Pseudomonas phage PhiPA3]
MVSINRSNAARLAENASTDSPFDQSYFSYGQTNPNQSFRFGEGEVERKVRFINESFHDLSIIDGTGMTLDLPASRTAGSRLVVCVSYRWGHQVQFNPAAMLKHAPQADELYVRKITSLIRNTDNNSPRELDLYYVVDLGSLDKDPYGIWIEPLNVQVVMTRYSKTTTFFTQDCFFNRNDELYEMEERVWATTVTLAYFVDDAKIVEKAYVPIGSDLLEVSPVYRPDVPRGIYINLRGDVSFAASKSNRRCLHVKPEEFQKYGIYRTCRDWEEAVKASAKGLSKDGVKAIMDVFQEVHGIKPEEDKPKAASIRDIVIVGEYTIGSVLDFMGELAKADSILEKLFKKR